LISQIGAELRSKNLKPVYFFYGKDGYEIERTTGSIKKYLEPELADESDVGVFGGGSTSIEQLLDFCETYSFVSEKRLAIVKNFNLLKFDGRKYNKQLISYFTNPAGHTTLILQYDDATFPDKEPYKTLASLGYVYVARTPNFDDLVNRVEGTAKNAAKRIDKHNAELLVSLVGDDRLIIEMQVEKLIEYAGDKTEITVDMIKRSVAPTKQFTIFDLVDKVLAKDKPAALRLLDKVMNQGEPALLILFHLNRQFAMVINIRELLSEGKSDYEASAELGIQKWQLDKLKPAARNFAHTELAEVYAALLRADIALKTGDTDEKTIMFTAINEILI